MTAAQRRAINRHNALKSTGPNTPEGKERTRLNALKHGLCAALLTFAIEDADDVQAQFDEWVEHYQPVGPAEFALVEDIALSHLRLRRCRSRETAVVEHQIEDVYKAWCGVQTKRIGAAQALLATHPAAAVHDLKQFCEGRRWLIDHWTRLCMGLYQSHYDCAPARLDQFVRLLGGDPARLAAGPLAAFKFHLACTAARPAADPKAVAELLTDAAIHPAYRAEFGREVPTSEECRLIIGRIIAEELDALNREEDNAQDDDRDEVSNAFRRVQLPFDCPDNKLALRYETVARSSLAKALKLLDHLQDERYAVEAERAADPDLIALADSPPGPVFPVARNEPEPPQEPQSSPDSETSCDPSTATNPDAPKGEPIMVAVDAGIIGIEVPAGVALAAPVMTLEVAASPPA